MSHDLVMYIFAFISALLAHFLGIRTGGTAALRAAALPVESKAKFPWGDVVRAFLEMLLKIFSAPGVLAKQKVPTDGGDRQNK